MHACAEFPNNKSGYGDFSTYHPLFQIEVQSVLFKERVIFFFSFFLFSPFPPLSLGNRVLAFYSLYLEEILPSFASGERMRNLFFFIGQGSKRSKVVSMGSFIVGTRS